MRSMATICGVLVLAGCSCDDEVELRVEGDRGYVRCFAAAAPEPRAWSVGERTLELDDERRLRITGGSEAVRFVAAAGPVGDDLSAVRALRPDVLAVLGDVAPASLATLAELEALVLVVPGGADEHAPLTEAFEALGSDAADRVLNAAVLRAIRLGPVELVPVAGAPGGRYAVGPEACGLGEDDVDAWDLGDAGEGVHRVLLSWAGPAGEGPASLTRGLENVEAGSPLIRRVAEATGAEGAVFAWPRAHAGRAEGAGSWGTRVALRPLSGAAVLRADGTRAAPGPTLVRITGEGLSVER